mgnify:FL=1
MTTCDTSKNITTGENARVYGLAADPEADTPTARFTVPTRGAGNPGDDGVTTPGSFANPAEVGKPLTFSSPDTPNMP